MVFGFSRGLTGLPGALLAIVFSTALFPAIVNAVSLEEVLEKQPNVAVFQGLWKSYPNIFNNLADVTVVVPNDAAFKKLSNWDTFNASVVEATLNYHILRTRRLMSSLEKGDSVWEPTMLDYAPFSLLSNKTGQRLVLTKQPGGEVVFTSGFATRGTAVVEDIIFDGGVVQIIDSVMEIPQNLASTAFGAFRDIEAFVGALFTSQLLDEINDTPGVNIFAPINTAFQQLAGALENMSMDKLRAVLRYHIVPDDLRLEFQLKNSTTLTASGGTGKLHITRHTNYIYVNSARLLQTDILLRNGVVHIIDNMLSPDAQSARPEVTKATQKPVFTPTGATSTGSEAPTPFVSNLPCTVSCPVSEEPTGSAAPTGAARPSSSNGAIPAARCTGLAGAGMGLGMAVGAIMLGL